MCRPANSFNHFPFYPNRFYITSVLPKINTHLFCFWNIKIQIIVFTPFDKAVYLLYAQSFSFFIFSIFLSYLHINHWAWTVRMPAVSCLQSEEEWSKYCTLWSTVLVHITADLVPFKDTKKGRFVRQLKTLGTTEEDSSFRSFWSIRWGWIVLRALEKSKNINLIVFPEVSKTHDFKR